MESEKKAEGDGEDMNFHACRMELMLCFCQQREKGFLFQALASPSLDRRRKGGRVECMKPFLYLPLAVLLSFHFVSSAQARYIRPDLEATPVDRLVKNLEAQVKAKPKDVRLRFNLARVHGMAFASKTDQTQIWRGGEARGGFFGQCGAMAQFGDCPHALKEEACIADVLVIGQSRQAMTDQGAQGRVIGGEVISESS